MNLNEKVRRLASWSIYEESSTNLYYLHTGHSLDQAWPLKSLGSIYRRQYLWECRTILRFTHTYIFHSNFCLQENVQVPGCEDLQATDILPITKAEALRPRPYTPMRNITHKINGKKL